MILNSPIEIIENVKNKMSEVVNENNLKHLDVDMGDLFIAYSADLCSILLNRFPGSTIMMHKGYKSCGIMIQGVIYTSRGITDPNDFFVAGQQEIGFIQKSFNQLSDYELTLLNDKLYGNEEKEKGISYKLRKNSDNLT